MRKDIEKDIWTIINDTFVSLIKVTIAAFVFIEVGHVEYSVAVSTACLLGATDFFSKTRDLRTPKKVKAKVRTKFSATSVRVVETHSSTTAQRHVSVSHVEGESE